jgi:hypothetical protein
MPRPYVGKGNCNVDGCSEIGDYINPGTKSLYCENHAKTIGYRIVYSESPLVTTQLEKIKNRGITPSRKKMESELKSLKQMVGN